MAALRYIACTLCGEYADASISRHLSAAELAPLVAAAPGLAALAQAKEALPSLQVLVLDEEVDLQFFLRHQGQGHTLAVQSEDELAQILANRQ